MQGYKDDFDLDSHHKTITTLLKAGVDPNATNTKTEMTCLHWAAFYPEDQASVAKLVDAGAKIFMRDHQGLTPIDIAGLKAEKGSKAVLDYLLNCAEKQVESTLIELSSRTENPIIIPIGDQSDTTVKVKPDLSEYCDEKKFYLNVLYWAAYRNRTALVQKLIGLGISPFVRYFQGQNAIFAAVKGGALETVKSIFKPKYECSDGSSRDIRTEGSNALDSELNSVLHVAAIHVMILFLCRNKNNNPSKNRTKLRYTIFWMHVLAIPTSGISEAFCLRTSISIEI